MSDAFFQVVKPAAVFRHIDIFPPVDTETVPAGQALDRVLAEDLLSPADLPGFARAVMDGYAVQAASTFGAGEGLPAYLTLRDGVAMGTVPEFFLGPGEAAPVATGGMLPAGADSVIILEKTRAVDEHLLEVYQPVAPGANMVAADEDVKQGERILSAGIRLRPQESGLLAALGVTRVTVYRQPVIGIISTGDELVPVEQTPPPGHIRDVNTATLSALAEKAGCRPRAYGIVVDDVSRLEEITIRAFDECDLVLLSGGSSVGIRDYTLQVLAALPQAELLVHGIAIRPGKPTILARVGEKALWGLPGQVTSAIIVFSVIVRPFIDHLAGLASSFRNVRPEVTAVAARNIPSVYGRTDYVRVKLKKSADIWMAHPIFGKSGLLNTMLTAEGLIAIDADTEGIAADTPVSVMLW